MKLGEKLRQARLEAGLSQRQLCGDVITRNMLSQIENGAARPSMDTLRYLAGRLGKTLSFFLDEQALESPNAALMDRARKAFDAGRFSDVLAALQEFREPDGVFGREKTLMECLTCLELAEQALEENRGLYALELLTRAETAGAKSGYAGETERRRLTLLARAKVRGLAEVCGLLPSLDEELLLRAGAALESGDAPRAAALLDAAEHQDAPAWNLLRGKTHLSQGAYAAAAACFHQAEDAYSETWPLLERCYRDLGDYKLAYEYACRQKK